MYTLEGIGTADWPTLPATNDVVTGDTSGARGFFLGADADSTQVLWYSGEFVKGESLTANGQTTTTVIAGENPADSGVSLSSTAMPWLAQDFERGHWSIGLPPGAPTHLFAVGGKIAATQTRSAGQHIDQLVTEPAFVLIDSYELSSPAGFEITYDRSGPAAARRLTLRNLGATADRAHLGAVHSHLSFNDGGNVSTSAYNVQSVSKQGTGHYLITFDNPAAAATYQTTVSTENPLEYAYIDAYTTSTLTIKIVTTGTATPVDLTGSCHVQCMGGDIP